MEDKDLQNLFKKLKKSEQSQAPDFDELLQRPRPVLKSSGKLRTLLRWAVAAAIIVGIGIAGIWRYQNNEQGQELAEVEENIVEDKSLENWEPKTDELLPDRNKDLFENKVGEIKIQPPKPIVLKEEIKALLKEVPELKAEDYKYGAISDWESPTGALMPF
jgi:uncharacterized protein HemX